MNTCWMCAEPERGKIALVYIYALGGADGWRERAERFVATYHQHPPGLDHSTVVVCNGAPADQATQWLFHTLPNLQFLERDDSGWDIGGYEAAARSIACDLMLFCGGHTYFRRAGWLRRVAEIYDEHGYGLYGATGHQGILAQGIHPHVRTTGFWCHPTLLTHYPYKVTQGGPGGQRYAMEHGKHCLSNWAAWQGVQRVIVGWDCVRPLETCDSMPNGYHQGDQSNVLFGDKMTAPPYYPHP